MAAEPLRALARPLRTLDPTAADRSDLAPLRDVVGDARVVVLGESAHHTAEFAQLRDRVLRFLVEEMGFSAFVLESGLPEGLKVDAWVRGGPGRLPTIAREGISWAMGRCTEMHAQLRWMRAHNAVASSPVGFYGMDVPGWLTNPAPGVAACVRRLEPHADNNRLLALADLGGRSSAPAPDDTDPSAVPDELPDLVAQLVERARRSGDGLALRCARGAQQVVEFLEHGLYPGPRRNLRNEMMAENLRWILGRQRRILVSAHNVHLQRCRAFDGTETVATLLSDELGTDLVVIGTTRAAGPMPQPDLATSPKHRYATSAGNPVAPSHSLDALMDDAGPLHLMDLQAIPRSTFDNVTTMLGQHTVIHLDEPRDAFDAVVHVRRITPAHGAYDDC